MSAPLSGAVLIVLLAAAIGPAAAVPDDPIAAAADRYASGDHEGAVEALRHSAGLRVAELTAGLEHWIAAVEPGLRDDRGRLAAAFALDVVWHSRGTRFGHGRLNYDPHGRVTPSEPERVLVSSVLAMGSIPRWRVDAVSLERVPIDVTMVLTGFPESQTAEHRRGLVSAEAIRRLLPAADRLRVVVAGETVRGCFVEPDFVVRTDQPTRRIAGVALVDGLFYSLAMPVDADRRHLVVAFTNGQDSYSVIDADRLPALVDRSDAVLPAVLWSSPNAGVQPSGRVITFGNPEESSAPSGFAEFRDPGWERTFRTLMDAVSRSGGTLRHAAADTTAFQTVLDDFRTNYVLSYSPRDVAATGWHELTVKITRRGSFRVRARKGYEAD